MSIDDVQDLAPRVRYVASAAQDEFDYPFAIFAAADLVVIVDDGNPLVLTTDYTVTGVGEDLGGTVTLVTPMVGGEIVTIYRDTVIERLSDQQQNGPIASSVFNDELDKLHIIAQELKAKIGRAIRFPFTAAITDSETELSPLSNWLDKFLYVSATGLLEAASVVSSVVPLTQSLIGSLLNPQTAAELLAGVDPPNKWYDEGDVRRYGAVGDGATDDTAAFVAAIAAAQAKPNGGSVHIPDGEFVITSTLLISDNRIHIVGNGPDATQIRFAPTANDTLFEFNLTAATSITQCSLKGVSISSDDSTYTKVAVELVDVAEFDLHDIFIGGTVVVSSTQFWSGANSIGLRVYGRQTLSVFNAHIQADRPIVMMINPNTFIDADHFNFHNLYIVGNGNPLIECEDGMSLSNCSWTGYQAWVLGTTGFKYTNTVAFGFNPYKLRFSNVRSEQGTSPSAYTFDISHTTGTIDDVMIDNCYLDINRNGIRTNRVMNITLDGVTFPSASLEALNITGVASGAANTHLSLRNCYWQTTSTATLTGLTLLWGMPKGGSTQPLPHTAEYAVTGKSVKTDGAIMSQVKTIAQDAAELIGPNTLVGYIFIQGQETTAGAIYHLNGTTNSATEVNDIASIFTPTKDTASSWNIYAESSNYWLQNKRGSGTLVAKWAILGTDSIST